MTPSTGHPNCMDEFDTGYGEVLAKAIEKDAKLIADRVLETRRVATIRAADQFCFAARQFLVELRDNRIDFTARPFQQFLLFTQDFSARALNLLPAGNTSAAADCTTVPP